MTTPARTLRRPGPVSGGPVETTLAEAATIGARGVRSATVVTVRRGAGATAAVTGVAVIDAMTDVAGTVVAAVAGISAAAGCGPTGRTAAGVHLAAEPAGVRHAAATGAMTVATSKPADPVAGTVAPPETSRLG
ncbi:hypothetical protein HK411_07470 [Calidifontibacter sp. DB2511S]|uniref:hypothetical protein n=1 Tax=Metallococcus carri TaxID=1656884 RepID=UPI00140E8AFB|nr:hypothetical protein [Metallococcus carri]NOP37404.1 hypothetical protein [Calidifontibacter sp. DB2511S]